MLLLNCTNCLVCSLPPESSRGPTTAAGGACLGSCCCLVSGQLAWRSFRCRRRSYRPLGAPTPKRRPHQPWMGRTGSTWPRGGASRPILDKYSSPYKVLERGNKAWKLQVGERVDVVSRDHLKPHLGSMAPNAASPSLAEKPGEPV